MNPAEGFQFVTHPKLNQVSELIRANWAKPCWHYDEGLLSLHIDRPTGDSTLTVGQVAGDGSLASFQAYMPFDLEYCGGKYRTVFASFLTVSSAFRGKGLAGPQQGELIDRAIAKGYDLYTTMCEVGAPSNRAVEKVFAKRNLEVQVVNVLQYRAALSKMVEPLLPTEPSGRVRRYTKADHAAILPLVRDLGSNVPMRKLIPADDVDFLLLDRPHTRTYVYHDGDNLRGFANLLLLVVLENDDSTSLNVYFDNVSFGDLDSDAQHVFLGDILYNLKETGYATAFLPDIGYLPSEPFVKYRFRMAPRQLNLYVAPLRKDVLPNGIQNVDSFYMDVY
jgi:hypothetical protein